MWGIKRFFDTSILVAGALALTAGSATAATIINTVSPSALSLSGTTIGTIKGINVLKTNTYDWTFSISGDPVGALSQMQGAITVHHLPVAEPIEFSLFSGTPLGANTLLDTSINTQGAAIFDVPLQPGDYFLQLAPKYIAVNKELVSGSIQLSAVPEPATWAMMLFGVGLLGTGLRMNRRKVVTGMAVA
jgi:hypothetical protein